MEDFDPVTDIDRSELVLDRGQWPNFHDAEVHELNMWRGDVRPDDDVWIGPTIEASFELCALEFPFIAVLKFHDCEAIELKDYDKQNAVYDLVFTKEARGYLKSGEPLPPWICVSFVEAFGMRLTFKCMRVEVLERRPVG